MFRDEPTDVCMKHTEQTSVSLPQLLAEVKPVDFEKIRSRVNIKGF
jgi:hypothetical protein